MIIYKICIKLTKMCKNTICDFRLKPLLWSSLLWYYNNEMPTNMQDKECKQLEWLEYSRITDLVPNKYTCILPLHRLLKNTREGGFKNGRGQSLKTWLGKINISRCLLLKEEKREFILSLTQRQGKEERWQGRLSKIHKTFHIYFLYHHCNSKI